MLKNSIKKIIIFLCTVFLIVIIIFGPLSYYLYNFRFYDELYEKNDVYDILDKDDVKIITEDVFSFFKSGQPFEEFELKGGISYFSSDEISHLNDVRILLSRILLVYYISTILFIVFLLILIERKYLDFLKSFCIVLMSASSFILFFLALLYFLGNNFWVLFEKFHIIFFPQGNWTFPEGSLLITIFPSGFFYDFFFKLLLASLIISLVLLTAGIAGIVLINKARKRNAGEK